MSIKHEIVSDLKRVAIEIQKTPTRIEYEKHGKHSERQILKEFGSYTAAIAAAGLAPTKKEPVSRADKKAAKEREKYAEIQRLNDRFEKEIQPYIGKYEKPSKGFLTVIAGSDFHSVWTDPFCLHVFIDACKRVQPDVIGLVGDIFDFYSISTFSKDPTRVLKLQAEIDYIVNNIFAPLRKACPKSQIDLFIGNHEWRLFKYLSSEAPGLANLRCLQFDKLFSLEEFNINLVARKSFLTAKKENDLQNFKVYGDSYVLTHGNSTAKHAAMVELKKYNLSGASGHVHRHQIFSENDLSGEKSWTTMGCMCRLESGEEYIQDIVRWNQGFEIAHIDIKNRRVVKEYIQINKGFAVVGGVYYTSKV